MTTQNHRMNECTLVELRNHF